MGLFACAAAVRQNFGYPLCHQFFEITITKPEPNHFRSVKRLW